MFRSDLTENRSGVVVVNDVNAKTMEILVHYFYTGELLPTWKDDDTVLEFTYASGKYQLTEVLKLLDNVLGSRDTADATHTDVELLGMAHKLHLKTAENELIQRIRTTTNKMNTTTELFTLWGVQK